MIRILMIVEMAGRPADYLKESLANHMNSLNKVKEITVHSIKVSEPTKIENTDGKKNSGDDLFTTFAEADLEISDFYKLNQIIFDFMPSSVEVINPANINMTSKDATDLLNNISGRLHRYDEVAKIAGVKIREMENQIKFAKEIINKKDEEIKKLSTKKSKKKSVTTKKSLKKK